MTIETGRVPERAILVGLSQPSRAPHPGGPGANQARQGSPASPAGRRAQAPAEANWRPGRRTDLPTDTSLSELGLLAETAGSEVVERLYQRRDGIRPATFLSKGKLNTLKGLCEERAADLVIFDEDLSPAQGRNLERHLERKVIDRTELILDIFASRARTREAMIQVELAQLQYMLPRLTGLWQHLSRQVGGIGTRGPGETQLEVDRRRVRQRIGMLKRRLEAVERERETQRRRRQRLYRASLVGYTNAGKSTLFNTLTRAGVLEEDRLFATLDTTTRRLTLRLPPEGGPPEALLLSDTVGFIRKLPHHLVASFRATLGEVRESECLIHIVDASHDDFRAHMTAVEEVIRDLMDQPPMATLLVFNKADLLSPEDLAGRRAEFPEALLISSRDRDQAELVRTRLDQLHQEAMPGV